MSQPREPVTSFPFSCFPVSDLCQSVADETHTKTGKLLIQSPRIEIYMYLKNICKFSHGRKICFHILVGFCCRVVSVLFFWLHFTSCFLPINVFFHPPVKGQYEEVETGRPQGGEEAGSKGHSGDVCLVGMCSASTDPH